MCPSVRKRNVNANPYQPTYLLACLPQVELCLLLSRPAVPAAAAPAAEEVEEDGEETAAPRRLAGPLWRRCGDFFYRRREYVLEDGVLTYTAARTQPAPLHLSEARAARD